jgi:hypothetical protein
MFSKLSKKLVFFTAILFAFLFCFSQVATAQVLRLPNITPRILNTEPEIKNLFARDLGNYTAAVAFEAVSDSIYACKAKFQGDYQDLKIEKRKNNICYGKINYRIFDLENLKAYATTNQSTTVGSEAMGGKIDNSAPEISKIEFGEIFSTDLKISIKESHKLRIFLTDSTFISNCSGDVTTILIDENICETTVALEAKTQKINLKSIDILGNEKNHLLEITKLAEDVQIIQVAPPVAKNPITPEEKPEISQVAENSIIPENIVYSTSKDNLGINQNDNIKYQDWLYFLAFGVGLFTITAGTVFILYRLIRFRGKALDFLSKKIKWLNKPKVLAVTALLGIYLIGFAFLLPSYFYFKNLSNTSKISITDKTSSLSLYPNFLEKSISNKNLQTDLSKSYADLSFEDFGDLQSLENGDLTDKYKTTLDLNILVGDSNQGQIFKKYSKTYLITQLPKLVFQAKQTGNKVLENYKLQVSLKPILEQDSCKVTPNLIYNKKIENDYNYNYQLQSTNTDAIFEKLSAGVAKKPLKLYFRYVATDIYGKCEPNVRPSNNIILEQLGEGSGLSSEEQQALNPISLELSASADNKSLHLPTSDVDPNANYTKNLNITPETPISEYKRRFKLQTKQKPINPLWQVSTSAFSENSKSCSSPSGLVASGKVMFESEKQDEFFVDLKNIIKQPTNESWVNLNFKKFIGLFSDNSEKNTGYETISQTKLKEEYNQNNTFLHNYYYLRVVALDNLGNCSPLYQPSNPNSITTGKLDGTKLDPKSAYGIYDVPTETQDLLVVNNAIKIESLSYEPFQFSKDRFDPDGHYIYTKDICFDKTFSFNIAEPLGFTNSADKILEKNTDPDKQYCPIKKGDKFYLDTKKQESSKNWWQKLKSAVGSGWKTLSTVIDYIANTYSVVYDKALDVAIFPLMVQVNLICKNIKCPDKLEEKLSEGLKFGTKIVLQSTLGIPATIPNSEALKGEAKDYIISTIAEETGVPEEVVKKGLEVVVEEYEKQLSSNNNPSDLIAPDPDYLERPGKLLVKVRNYGKEKAGANFNFSFGDTNKFPDHQTYNLDFYKNRLIRVPAIDPGKEVVIPVYLYPEFNNYTKNTDCEISCASYFALAKQRWEKVLQNYKLDFYLQIKNDYPKDPANPKFGINMQGFKKIEGLEDCYWNKSQSKIKCFKFKFIGEKHELKQFKASEKVEIY